MQHGASRFWQRGGLPALHDRRWVPSSVTLPSPRPSPCMRVAQLIGEFQETTNTFEHAALAILQTCHFDVELAKSRWFESSPSKARLLAEACVENLPEVPERPAEWEGMEEADCMTCWDSKPLEEMDAAPCGHWVCRECWESHVASLAESKVSLMLPLCVDCGHRLPDRLVAASLAKQPKLLARWKRWRLEGLADDDKTARTCPTSGCQFVCKYPKGIARDIVCPSGHIFCFACGQEGHNPASCADVVKWRALMSDGGMDMKWIQSNCRPCPKCGLSVEKNGGCERRAFPAGFAACLHCLRSCVRLAPSAGRLLRPCPARLGCAPVSACAVAGHLPAPCSSLLLLVRDHRPVHALRGTCACRHHRQGLRMRLHVLLVSPHAHGSAAALRANVIENRAS